MKNFVTLLSFSCFLLIYLESVAFLSASSENEDEREEIPEIPGINVEQLLWEIGDEKETDLSVDDLILPELTEQEVKEFIKKKPYLETIGRSINRYDEEKVKKNKVYDQIEKVATQLFIHKNRQSEFDDTTVEEEIFPGFRIANSLFYKLYHLTEKIGVNQEYRDTIVQLIKKAKENVDLINARWASYQEFVSAQLIQPLDKLEKKLQEIANRKDEYLAERKYSEAELKEIERRLARTQSSMKSALEKEAYFRKMLSTFLKEEKNLIRLGIKVWPTSQQDYSVDDIDAESSQSSPNTDTRNEKISEDNEYTNQLNRKFVTQLNLMRASTPNVTDDKQFRKTSKELEEPKKLKKTKSKEEL